jgi:Mrp family chromosome partitioning ATPase
MSEIDAVLARAYSLKDQPEAQRNVPPAPHLAAGWRPQSPAQPATQPEASTELKLEWPAVVLALEKDWGDRFDKLAARLIAEREPRNLRVILFTSCHRAEGRTTLVLTLARALSRHPARTLVLDGDLTGPTLARQVGLRPEVGLNDVVENGHALSDALIDAPRDHLVFLPLRSAVLRPRDFLLSSAWTCVLARLRREFDLVLIDGGPLFTGLSAAALHRSVDAAVLVHHRGTTGEGALLRAQEVLAAGGVPLLGLAETFV